MNTQDNRIPKKQITFTGQLLDYKNFVGFSDTFLETGTAAGDGVQRALNAGFLHIASCEAAKEWYEQSVTRFKEIKGGGGSKPVATIHNLKSTSFLSMFVSSVVPQVIFLDAHPAGPLSAGHAELVAGDKTWEQDSIIKAELEVILKKYKEHVIIIDDVNGMADGHAEEYMGIMLHANGNYKFYFYDENLSGNPEHYYKDKILVAIP